MRVAFHLVQARREKLAALLKKHGYLSIGELCQRLDISEATARRDLAVLKQQKVIKRTYGGALGGFDDRFPSFSERRSKEAEAKKKIGRAAARLIEPNGVYYFDCGTTIFALAEAFCAQPRLPVTIVTCSIPVGELLAGIPGIKAYLLAGRILSRQSILLGEAACKSLAFWDFDMAFLSAEAINEHGIWNSDEAIVEQQKAALLRCKRHVFCVDGSKLGGSAPHFLLPWKGVDHVSTNLASGKLSAAGIRLTKSQYLQA